jgi:hypothetical protein
MSANGRLQPEVVVILSQFILPGRNQTTSSPWDTPPSKGISESRFSLNYFVGLLPS